MGGQYPCDIRIMTSIRSTYSCQDKSCRDSWRSLSPQPHRVEWEPRVNLENENKLLCSNQFILSQTRGVGRNMSRVGGRFDWDFTKIFSVH